MRSAAGAVAVVSTALFLGCFRFEEAKLIGGADSGSDATTTEDTTPEVALETGPTMCDRVGGRAVVDKAMANLITTLKVDCRVDRYFLGMAPDRLQHMHECMASQLGWIMRCPGVPYPAKDSKGEECRDVHQTHKGLGIHNEDFDAMVDDILAVLTTEKVAAADLAIISDALRIQRTDIVNPGDAGRGDACKPESGTVVDTGVEEY